MSEIPRGVPQAVKVSTFARAINMDTLTVKKWVDKGAIKTLYTPAHADRYIPVSELARYEEQGWKVRWSVIPDRLP